MTKTYIFTWANPEHTVLQRVDDQGNLDFVPTDPRNRDYAEFLASGAVASEYIAPEPPAPLTAAQKLEAAGLTVDDLKELLGLSTSEVAS